MASERWGWLTGISWRECVRKRTKESFCHLVAVRPAVGSTRGGLGPIGHEPKQGLPMSLFPRTDRSASYMQLRVAMGAVFALAWLGSACALPPPRPMASGIVMGRIESGSAPLPRLVYLEPQGSSWPATAGPQARTELALSHLLDAKVALVRSGLPIQFENDTPVIHRLFSRSSRNPIRLDPLGSGSSVQVPAPEIGEIRVYCELHPWEDATLLAAPTHWGGLVDASGAFRIQEVSEGSYRLIVWDDGSVRGFANIRVMEGATVSIDLPVQDRSEAGD